jgi:CRISPR/Cas system-associated endoribonuclease Cas2
VQESVFVANLDDELAGRMRERVAKLIDEQWDRIHIFELCRLPWFG